MRLGTLLHRATKAPTCACQCWRNGYRQARIDTLRRIFPRMPEHGLRKLLRPIR